MTATAAARRTRRPKPTRVLENAILAELGDGALVAGMDEVGRGALAGPVSVGVAVVSAATSRRMPPGLADSKLLTAQAREDLVAPVRAWCTASAVGHASAAEIDELGIIAALRLAGRRALAELAGAGVVPGMVILDGVHDWLAEPAQLELFAPRPPAVLVPGSEEELRTPPVRTQVKGDARCAVVAAASVLAKVARDAIMVGMHEEHPRYHWAGNKGYSSPEHVTALSEHGPCELHRRSWRLPGVGAAHAAQSGADLAAAAPDAAGGWSPDEAGGGWAVSLEDDGEGWAARPDEDGDGWAARPDEDGDGWGTTADDAAAAGAGVLVGGA
ncbi:ribonuclease HII [Georgenia daeguensis]|uniref:Ribonuclease n=1 Tax=Georgenia daeguensis TaxID=908355 RepID=A0ABP8ES02_9MICO